MQIRSLVHGPNGGFAGWRRDGVGRTGAGSKQGGRGKGWGEDWGVGPIKETVIH